MSNLQIDVDQLARLKNDSISAPHFVNNLILNAQEVIGQGGVVIVKQIVDGHEVVLERATTPEELTAFIGRHFPHYIEELKTATRSGD